MKKITLLLLLNSALIFFNSSAQSPNWLWAKSAGGTSFDGSWSCATDADGNVFTSGYFQSPSITFGSITLTNAGSSNIFITKYDPSGNVLWAKSAGGTLGDGSYSCATDVSGNVFVTGYFSSPSITFGTTTLTNSGVTDMFMAKYDPSGNVLWAKSGVGTDNEYSNTCATDAGGNVFATGYFQSSSLTFGSTTLTNAGTSGDENDMFIVKYDPSGNVLWAKSAGGTGESDNGSGCATDAGGNVLVTGHFDSPSITFGSTTLTNAGLEDLFIVKYDPNGNVLWAKRAGGTDYDGGSSCSTDAGGNVFATSYFDSDSITFGSTTLTNAGVEDMFMVKYDPSGNVLWAKSAGGTDYDYSSSCATDAGGNVFASGSFSSSSITFGSTTLTNAGTGYDIFIVKYDQSGNVLWAKSAGGTAFDNGSSCAADADGNVFVNGSFSSSSITFGSTVLTNDSAGTRDMYIVKLGEVTGIEENNLENAVNIFPNPFSNQLTSSLADNEQTTFSLYSFLGQQVLQQTFTNSTTINTGQLADGIYFYELRNSKGTLKTGKVVKQ